MTKITTVQRVWREPTTKSAITAQLLTQPTTLPPQHPGNTRLMAAPTQRTSPSTTELACRPIPMEKNRKPRPPRRTLPAPTEAACFPSESASVRRRRRSKNLEARNRHRSARNAPSAKVVVLSSSLQRCFFAANLLSPPPALFLYSNALRVSGTVYERLFAVSLVSISVKRGVNLKTGKAGGTSVEQVRNCLSSHLTSYQNLLLLSHITFYKIKK